MMVVFCNGQTGLQAGSARRVGPNHSGTPCWWPPPSRPGTPADPDRIRAVPRTTPREQPLRPHAPAQLRTLPLFPADPVAGKEARQAARAGLDALLSQPVAHLAQEKTRLLLGDPQDQPGMRLDALRGVIATHRLGGELALVAEALRSPDGTRRADPEAGCGTMAGGARHHGSHDTLA